MQEIQRYPPVWDQVLVNGPRDSRRIILRIALAYSRELDMTRGHAVPKGSPKESGSGSVSDAEGGGAVSANVLLCSALPASARGWTDRCRLTLVSEMTRQIIPRPCFRRAESLAMRIWSRVCAYDRISALRAEVNRHDIRLVPPDVADWSLEIDREPWSATMFQHPTTPSS